MGRGRAKAKQQKVARELKYSTHNTDLSALQRELSGYPPAPSDAADDVDTDDEGDFDEDYDRWTSRSG
jgi:hypothetical protein